MKNINIIFSFSMLLTLYATNTTFANDPYMEAMQKCITELYHATEIPQFQEAINKLERIASAETKEWQPEYYIAFGNIMIATRETTGAKKDAYLDRAIKSIEKAKQLANEESEIIALEGFVYMLRVSVDPQGRGPELAPIAVKTFGKAIALNQNNPRALALLAQMQMGTAQFFGTSTAEACALIKKALEKFATDGNAGPLDPRWGKVMAESVLHRCN